MDIEKRQREICRVYSADFVGCDQHAKVGIALHTISQLPINGLRHPPENGTTGWYIWGGLKFSDHSDFFQPMHVEHLVEYLPKVIDFLGLPPGYRFLIDGDYVDIWFDNALLNTAL